jgi:hypothetical protein
MKICRLTNEKIDRQHSPFRDKEAKDEFYKTAKKCSLSEVERKSLVAIIDWWLDEYSGADFESIKIQKMILENIKKEIGY